MKHPMKLAMLAVCLLAILNGASAQTPLDTIRPTVGDVIDFSPENIRSYNVKAARWKQLTEAMDEGKRLSDEEMRFLDEEEQYGLGAFGSTGTLGCSWHCAEGEYHCTTTTPYQGVSPDFLLDENFTTAWLAPRLAGKAAYPTWSVEYKECASIHTIILYNGYLKDAETYRSHARPSLLLLSTNGKPHCILRLEDVMAPQTFHFKEIPSTYTSKQPLKITLTVLAEYAGKRFKKSVSFR